MIREEYYYSDLEKYLNDSIDMVIIGQEKVEERSRFFYDKWKESNKMLVIFGCYNEDAISVKVLKDGIVVINRIVDFCVGIPRLMKEINVSEKKVLLDMSSLDNVSIMFLTKQLLMDNQPKDFFSAYIRPNKYCADEESISTGLSKTINAVGSVPGFVRRESDNQVLCAFVGFEGIRFKAVMETIQKINKIIPIVAFPSGSVDWYNISMWNIMDVLQNETENLIVNKCLSESLFGAVNMLESIVESDEKVVLAPLGTRVHSMACAVYACRNKNARIVYDFVIEKENRAVGISDIIIYHMSPYFMDR